MDFDLDLDLAFDFDLALDLDLDLAKLLQGKFDFLGLPRTY